MAAGTVNNVSVGKPNLSGAIWRAKLPLPEGVTLPENTTDTLTGFSHLGYCNEDGVTNETNQGDSVKAWGGDVVLQTGKEDTFSFTLIESLNANVQSAVYGDNNVETITVGEGTSATTETKISVSNDDSDKSAYVIDTLLKGGRKKRIVIPSASITELSEITYKDDEPIGYNVTLTADADNNGNTHFEYITEGAE